MTAQCKGRLEGRARLFGRVLVLHLLLLGDGRQAVNCGCRLTGLAGDRRQEGANALPEIRRTVGGPRRLVDKGAATELVERQGRVNSARMVEIAVDETVEQMADVEPAGSAGRVCVTYDVDRAAVAQQMIEFRPIGQFVDPR